jgi:hypothetical protein
MAHQTCLIGYPPADHQVRQFLTRGGPDEKISHLLAISLVRRFLVALFNKTAEALNGATKQLRIQNFRNFMSENQTMDSAGRKRLEFYDSVIAQAQGVRCRFVIPFILSDPLILKGTNDSSDEPDSAALTKALKELRKALNVDNNPTAHSVHVEGTQGSHDRFVDVFVVFDEAQTLVNSTDDRGESRFVVLRRELCSLSSQPLFSFFLSTTGNVTQFGHPRGHDPSNRINEGALATPRPYIYLGFDQLMQTCKVFSRWKTLEDVTSLECAAHMGRPL